MLLTKLRALFIVAVIGLSIGACSQRAGEGEVAASDDTAVRAVEVAPGGTSEFLDKGRNVYLANCAACHQPAGTGLAGAFPPLAGSDFLQGNREGVLAAALFGLQGPITVNGVEYNGVMPAFGHLRDEELAAAITYVFGSWGNNLAAVSAEEVAALREKSRQ